MSFDAGTVTAELELDRSPFITSLNAAREQAMRFARSAYNATLGADVTEFQTDLDRTSSAARRFASEAYEATLGADDGPFVQGLGRATLLGEQFATKAYEASLGGDATGFARDVADATRQGEDFERERFEATVTANDRPGRRVLNGFDQVMRKYGRSWGQQGVRARVVADTRRALTQIRYLERVLEDTEDEETRVRVEAEVRLARERLEGLQRLSKALGIQSPTINVGIRGTAATYASMLGLQGLADRLDGYNIRINADVDRSISQALPQVLGALEQQLVRFRSVMTAFAAVTVPVFYSALATIPAVVAGAAGAVSSLTISVGQGLVGALGAVGGAAGLAGGAILGYGAALQRTINYVGDFTSTLSTQRSAIESANLNLQAAKQALEKAEKGTREYALAQRGLILAQQSARYEQERFNTMLQIATPRIITLNRQVNEAQLGLLRFGGRIMHAVAPALLLALRRWKAFADPVSDGAVEMAEDMDAVAQQFIRIATTGQNLKSITTILNGIKSAGVPAMRLVGNGAVFLLNVLAPIVPTSLSLLRYVTDLVAVARRWSGTADGQRTIGRVWEYLFNQGRKLWRIGVNLGVALWGVGRALQASGTGNWLLAQIERLSVVFRQNLQAGGAWRGAIRRFMEDLRPVLRAVGPLITEVARGAAWLIDVVMNTRQPNGTRTLVAIIRSMVPVVRELVHLLGHEFKVIAPLLPGIIRDLGEWFNTFARATPEMIAFIKIFGKVLDWFTDLPQKQQIAIARTLAYVSAFKALGGGAALSALATLTATVVQWRLMRNIWLSMPKQPPIGGPVGGPGRGGRIPPPVVPAPVPRKGFWASLGAILAGIGARIRSFKVPALKLLPRILGGVGVLLAVEPWLRRNVTQPIVNWFGRQRWGYLGKMILRGIVAGLTGDWMRPVIRWFRRQWNGLLRWLGIRSPSTKAAREIGRPIVQGILMGILNFPILGRIRRWADRVVSGARRAFERGGWRALGAWVVRQIVQGLQSVPLLGGFVRRVAQFIRGARRAFQRGNWRGLGSYVVRQIVRGLLSVPLLGGFVRRIQQFIRGARRAFERGRWRGLGSYVVRQIVRGLMSVPLLGGFLRRIRDFTKGARRAFQRGGWRGMGEYVVKQIVEGIKRIPLVGPLIEKIGDLVRGARDAFARGGWRALGSFALAQLRDGLSRGLQGLARWARATMEWVGEMLVYGFQVGIARRARQVWGTLGRLAQAAVSRVMKILGIGSPSKVFVGIGENLGDSMARGIERTMGRVLGAASRMGAGAISAASGVATIEGRYVSPVASLPSVAAAAGTGTGPGRVLRRRRRRTSPPVLKATFVIDGKPIKAIATETIWESLGASLDSGSYLGEQL